MADVTGGTPPTGASPFRVPEDFKATYDHFGDQSMFSVATKAALPTTGNWNGRVLGVADIRAVFVWFGAWFGLASKETARGSVVPTAGSGFTLSNNNLYVRSGFLLGSIDWSKGSTLGHADVILKLPAGSRPVEEYVVQATMGPSPSVIVPLNVSTAGDVSALAPTGGRTSGTIKFIVPLPM